MLRLVVSYSPAASMGCVGMYIEIQMQGPVLLILQQKHIQTLTNSVDSDQSTPEGGLIRIYTFWFHGLVTSVF